MKANNMSEINEDTVRAEVRAWLEANWNPDYGLVEWRLKLAESGCVPHWPSRWYGRGLPVGLVPVVEEEFKRNGAIGVAKVGSAPSPPRPFSRTAPICRRRSSCCAF
jgi:hypothetical protein